MFHPAPDLAHSFLSPSSNRRADRYGSSFENCARFILETFAAVREVWPDGYPLSARLGVVEYDGQDEGRLRESIALIALLRRAGLDFVSVSVSVGFSTPEAAIPWSEPAFMAPVIDRLRRESGLPVALAWGAGAPEIADHAVRSDRADMIKVGRALLANPHWPYVAARALAAWRRHPGPRFPRRTPMGSNGTSRQPRSRPPKDSWPDEDHLDGLPGDAGSLPIILVAGVSILAQDVGEFA